MALRTMALTDSSGRTRGAPVYIGDVDKDVIRAEHQALAPVVAAVCGCDVSELTLESIAKIDLKVVRDALTLGSS